MICKDSDVASKVIACTQSISCVTISGEVHHRKGTLTGGHRDERRYPAEHCVPSPEFMAIQKSSSVCIQNFYLVS